MVFAAKYHGRWSESSGKGSTLEATRDLRETIPQLVRELGVTSVLDAGCGDGLWMPDLPGYVGVDITGEAVERSRLRHPGRRYEVADIRFGPLPYCELVLCRDVLIHLPIADGLSAIRTIRATGAAWLVATTYPGEVNRNIREGRFYRANLEAEPFDLGPADRLEWNGSPESVARGKRLGVWRLR